MPKLKAAGKGTHNLEFITSVGNLDKQEDGRRRRKVRSQARLAGNGAAAAPGTQPVTWKSQWSGASRFRVKPIARPKPSSTRRDEDNSESKRATHALMPACHNHTRVMELPNFSGLSISLTPATEHLFQSCILFSLSPTQRPETKVIVGRRDTPFFLNAYNSGFLPYLTLMTDMQWQKHPTMLDPVMAHSFLSLLSALYTVVTGSRDTHPIDFHRHYTIRLINQKLELNQNPDSGPTAQISDELVLSVAMLVNTEVCVGNVFSATAHVNAMRKMVAMRGGLIQGFGHNQLLCNAICWADSVYKLIFGGDLNLSLVDRSTITWHHQNNPKRNFRFQRLLEGTKSPSDLMTISDTDSLVVLDSLHSLVQLLMSETNGPHHYTLRNPIETIDYHLSNLEDKRHSRAMLFRPDLDHLTLAMTNGDDDDSTGMPYKDLSEILVYACHIFLFLAILPPSSSPSPVAAEVDKKRGRRGRRYLLLIRGLRTAINDVLIALKLRSFRGRTGVVENNNMTENTFPSPSSSFQSPELSPPLTSYQKNQENNHHNDEGKEEEEEEEEGREDDDDDEHSNNSNLHQDIFLWALFIGCCIPRSDLGVAIPRNHYNHHHHHHNSRHSFSSPDDDDDDDDDGDETKSTISTSTDHTTTTPTMNNPTKMKTTTTTVTATTDDDDFYATSLRDFCLSRGLLDREVVRRRLRGNVIWLDGWCDERLDEVWWGRVVVPAPAPPAGAGFVVVPGSV